ncbi:hypothetical protein, partial [Pluralibacter gergoviae]|uniref:hypothetical protein n=1 Tax=Pluralibacter gergoviae TaxID=61647 RepID=UPI001E2D0F7F
VSELRRQALTQGGVRPAFRRLFLLATGTLSANLNGQARRVSPGIYRDRYAFQYRRGENRLKADLGHLRNFQSLKQRVERRVSAGA